MLLSRSIIIQISLLVAIPLAKCQEYDAEYEAIRDGEGDDSSDYEQAAHPDYTKYFNAEASSPIASLISDGNKDGSGFVVPLDFSSFFNDENFGFGSASDKKEVVQITNPFQPEQNPSAGFVNSNDFKNGFAALASENFDARDYYEAAQTKPEEQKTTQEPEKDYYESKPGPSYVSHKTPAKYAYVKTHRTGVASEVHDLTEKPPKSAEVKSYSVPDYSSLYVPPQPIPLPANPGKVVDYNVGKSSSTVSQNPLNPGYYSKLLKTPPSPYELYSFQPASSDYLTSVLSTVAPFNPSYAKVASTVIPNIDYQASNNDPQVENNRNCKKVDKQITAKDIKTGRFRRQAMNCYVCQDPKTKANYEQCSYSSEPKASAGSYYSSATAQKYSAPSYPTEDSFRYKRESEDEAYADPYDYVKSQSKVYNSRPKAFDEDKHYLPKDYDSSEYRFKPEYFSQSSAPEKSFSEAKAEEVIAKGENCQKVKKDQMTCIVCQSAETGGNYEQCSYTSAPEQQRYAYVKEQKYNSDDPNPTVTEEKSSEGSAPQKSVSEEEEEKKPAQTEQKDVEKNKSPYEHEFKFGAGHDYFKDSEKERESESSNKKEEEKQSSEEEEEDRPKYDYSVPSHFEETTQKETKTGGRGLDPTLYGSPDASETVEKKEENSEYPKLNEYHFKYFPDFLKEESKKEEVAQPDHTKKDVEEVLKEFAKKDRSQCKKAHKNGMTCYLCVDEKGLQHEECMYVSESKPKSSHIAYHQAQETKDAKKPAESKPVAAVHIQDPSAIEPIAAASEEVYSRIKYKALGPYSAEYQQKRSVKEVKNKNPKKYKGKKSKDVSVAESRNDEQNDDDNAEQKNASEIAGKNSEEEEIDELEDRVNSRYREVGEKERAESERLERQESGEAPKKEQQRAQEEEAEEEPSKEPETPEEFKVGDKEGAFSEEVKPVFSKALGVTLPKYMLTKSESEAIFDEFVASG